MASSVMALSSTAAVTAVAAPPKTSNGSSSSNVVSAFTGLKSTAQFPSSFKMGNAAAEWEQKTTSNGGRKIIVRFLKEFLTEELTPDSLGTSSLKFHACVVFCPASMKDVVNFGQWNTCLKNKVHESAKLPWTPGRSPSCNIYVNGDTPGNNKAKLTPGNNKAKLTPGTIYLKGDCPASAEEIQQ